jgi:hypothetical protein
MLGRRRQWKQFQKRQHCQNSFKTAVCSISSILKTSSCNMEAHFIAYYSFVIRAPYYVFNNVDGSIQI